MSKTYSEIKNQYDALRKTYEYLVSQTGNLKEFFQRVNPQSIVFIGSGSSYFISQSLEMAAKIKLGINCSALPAGDLMLDIEKYKPLLTNSMIFAISRSGSTSEIINAINNVKSITDASVLSITCTYDSPLTSISDYTVEIPWAFDESVCQTRTVTNLYSSGLQIISSWCGDKETISDIDSVIKIGNEYLEKNEAALKNIVSADWDDVTILADGELQGISMEAALAFKEISQLRSNYYHVLDSRHGPIVMIGPKSLVIACLTGENYSTQVSLIKDILKKGAKVVVYTDVEADTIDGVLLHVNSGISICHSVKGIPFINIAQLISYYKAIKRGVNPDQPDGLDAWIELK